MILILRGDYFEPFYLSNGSIFDEKNHTIRNLKISTIHNYPEKKDEWTSTGFFEFSQGVIKNLTIENIEIIHKGYHNVGGLVGYGMSLIYRQFLKGLPWGKTLELEGNYLTLIVMNFVIALCMVGTPLVVRSLVSSGFTAFTSSLTPIVVMTMVSTQAKALKLARLGSSF